MSAPNCKPTQWINFHKYYAQPVHKFCKWLMPSYENRANEDERLKKLLETSDVGEDLIYCNTEQTVLLAYDPLIEQEPTAVEFATSVTLSEPVVRKNNKSPKNLFADSSQNMFSLNTLNDKSEGNEEEPMESFICGLCSSSFRLNKTYRQHMKKVHNKIISPSAVVDENEKNLSECDICNSIFKNRFAVWAHKKRLHPPIPPAFASEDTEDCENSLYYKECTLCSCTFISKEAYRRHMKKVHVQNVNDEHNFFECEICKLHFKHRTSVYMHKKRKHPEIINKSKLIKNRNILVEAETEVAEEDGKHLHAQGRKKRLFCASCSREYKSYSALCNHEKRCRSKDQPAPVHCPICSKKVINLKLHMKNIHTSVGNYICSICGNSFKNYVQMYKHKRLHMERKIACTLCEKKFVRSSDLRIHLRTHTGEQPYVCHLCDRSFKMSTQLTYHLQRHAGIKQKCNVCGAQFNYSRQLYLHSFKHTGMPFKCPICEYGCVKRDVFNTHTLRMHNMTMTNEELCLMFKENTGRHPRVRCIEEFKLEEN